MIDNHTPAAAYNALSGEHKAFLDAWIEKHIRPAQKVNEHSSYWFKHVVEREMNAYISSIQFAGAMINAGYAPVSGHSHPWLFHVAYIERE